MADSLWMRLRNIDWEDKKIPRLLENLASKKLPRSMKASHELWVKLCSGGVKPQAAPCIPFLLDIFKISEPCVQSEILDILIICSNIPKNTPLEDWQSQIHKTFLKHQSQIKRMTHTTDSELKEKAVKLANCVI